MGGLLLIYLLIRYWFIPVGALAFFVFVLCLDAYSDHQARLRREAADLLRHQRARAEIDHIVMATSRAMTEAAFVHAAGQVIEGTAVEVGANE